MKFRTKRFKAVLASLTLAASILLALPAMADGERCKRGKCSPEERVSRMQEKLNLSDEQASQVRAIFEAHQAEFDRIKQERKSTLTDQQRQALKESRKARKASGEARPSREERAQRLAEMGVSEGQQAQLRSLREQMKTEREAIRQELRAVLTPEQQATFDERKKRGKRGRRSRG